MNEKSVPVFSRRQKLGTTFGICFGNFCIGICLNVYSPLVVELSNKFGVLVGEVAVIFTVLNLCYLIGALLTSFIFKFLNRQLGVCLSLTGITISLFLTPHCPTIFSLLAVVAFLGFCIGVHSVGQTVWVIEMWQPGAGPFIQGQHFSFAVGSLVPSIIVGPFLTPEHAQDHTNLESTLDAASSSQMWIPFTISGILAAMAAIFQLYFFIFERYSPPPPVELQEKQETRGSLSKQEEISKVIDPKYLKVMIIVLSATFLGFYQGLEMTTFQFISTFAQLGPLQLSQAEGAQIMTGLTASFTLFRGLAVLANLKVPAISILTFNILMLFVSYGVLIIFGGSIVGLWTGVVLLGLGCSATYPSFCAYIERHLEFTNAIGSTMLVSGSLVAAIFPLIIGAQIENNAIALIYVDLITTTLITVALIVILKFTFKRSPTKL